ncbi:hypothetical protein JOF56_006571 [Kibdelosporangium banguiense]|uniref:Uncharacterized protein n=1 Tax=Kibdelosporangium banguiense TaxID=1365924 RepID=A0ABS4TQN6_9PSEU|nr:hypothetical protein [Kibdelosporangium banguiense]MBP2326186.1 hypothetical protein [Kibdelosporangium banguiense]
MTQTPKVEDVLDYLRAHGWTMTGSWRNATVWSLREFDVLVPPTDAVADRPGRLRELVQCVAESEGRTPRMVRRDIALPAVDVVSYRARDTTESVTLPTGMRSLRAARDLVVACAREVVVETSQTVGTLLERSFLSLSEEVFGVDIALPYEELGRRTALRVLRSSTTVLKAVGSPDEDAFEQVFREGVSKDVCVALADLAGQDRRGSFELGFRWSRRAPLKDQAVEFPAGVGRRIRAAGKRTEPPAEDAVGVVEGPVHSLSDDENGERWRIGVRGVLQIDGTASGRRRLVPVWLRSAQDYDAALVAHREGNPVRAQGAITNTRGVTAADNGFTVIRQT